MSGVAAVVLSVGETTTARAFWRRPTAAARVSAPFFVQVDGDMVLDPDCFERLRDAMDDDVGMAVGALRDPLIGPVAGAAWLASRDSAALAEAMLTAARDPELRERIGREARRRVARHSLERVVDAYDELLGRAARPEGA